MESEGKLNENGLGRWEFHWPVMDVLIGGKSSIDLDRLRITSESECDRFIKSYGYDPDSPEDARLIHAVIIEALGFIEHTLLSGRWGCDVRCPDEVVQCQDVRELLMWASDPKRVNGKRRAWSCALLRVMHTIAHIEGAERFVDLEVARKKILNRFSEMLFRDEGGALWLGQQPDAVQLDHVEFKRAKSRQSILLKLLHKPANVAETIYDLLGVRLVTLRLCDAMLVVKYLRQYQLVTFANCNPTRARNTLLDTEGFRHNVSMINDLATRAKLTKDELDNLVSQMTVPLSRRKTPTSSNPHSSHQYRSIQLTCRELVRVGHPAEVWAGKVAKVVEEANCPKQVKDALKNVIDLAYSWPQFRVSDWSAFFPYEVQILDRDSYKASQLGDASHDRYKQSQIRTARRRVLREIMQLK